MDLPGVGKTKPLHPMSRVAARVLALTGKTRQAAAAARVSEDTVTRWKKIPAFARLVAEEAEKLDMEQRREMRVSIRRLRGVTGKALDGLEAIVRQRKSVNAKLRAIALVLKSQGLDRIHELEEAGETPENIFDQMRASFELLTGRVPDPTDEVLELGAPSESARVHPRRPSDQGR